MKHDFDILVVDDEQVVVDSVIKLCSGEGLTVDSAMDAMIALEKVSKHSYRIIISDIMMPEVDGFEFLNRLQEQKILTPLIMTTGFSTVENAVKSLYSGAIDFLPKPFTVDELLSVVDRGLKYSEMFPPALYQDSDSRQVSKSVDFVPCPPSYYRLGYSSWAFLEDIGAVKIGITDQLLHTIDVITSIDFFGIDEEIIQGNPCAYLSTDDGMTHQILAPITGRIIEKNEELAKKSDLIMKDPYFQGWLYSIIPSDLEFELKHLTHCSSDRV